MTSIDSVPFSAILFYQPHAGWQESTSPFTAGGYQAVGAVGVGVSKAKAEQLQAQLEASQAALEAQDSATLNKHDLTGALMQTSLMNYFAQIWAKAEMTARSSKVVHYSMPSYGTISTRSDVALLYGLIRRTVVRKRTLDSWSNRQHVACACARRVARDAGTPVRAHAFATLGTFGNRPMNRRDLWRLTPNGARLKVNGHSQEAFHEYPERSCSTQFTATTARAANSAFTRLGATTAATATSSRACERAQCR